MGKGKHTRFEFLYAGSSFCFVDCRDFWGAVYYSQKLHGKWKIVTKIFKINVTICEFVKINKKFAARQSVWQLYFKQEGSSREGFLKINKPVYRLSSS